MLTPKTGHVQDSLCRSPPCLRSKSKPCNPESALAKSGPTSEVTSMPTSLNETARILVRHEGQVGRERSACGWRDRLISREDAALSPAAWAHAVDIDGARA